MSTIIDPIGLVLNGRYRLEAVIGSGASANVFVAYDVTLERKVAIKVLHPGLAGDKAFLRRFQAEARSVAALRNPHILAVYDWGEHDGSPYLVLEHLGGGSLRDVLDTGTHLSLAQVVDVGRQAAEGLTYAHGRGLVHRDVKPANLLFDDDGRLTLADFGLARALAEAAWTEPVGVAIGTARYASPEQAQGQRVDGRGDVYSLALVLYEAITGTVPHTSDTTLATLTARVGARIPDDDRLGALGPLLSAAAHPEVDNRLSAVQFAARLRQLAAELGPPKPLALAAKSPVIRTGSFSPPPDATVHGAVGVPATEDEIADAMAVATAVGIAGTDHLPRGSAVPLAAGVVPAAPTRPVKKRRWPWWVLAAVLVLGAGGGGGTWYALKTKLFVPTHRLADVSGLTISAANAQLTGDHFTVHQRTLRSSTSVPAGIILREIPGPGTVLHEHAVIQVVVSSGPPPVPVPASTLSTVTTDNGTSPCSQAASILGGSDLTMGACTGRSSTTVVAGSIISWSPDTSTAPQGSPVSIVYSTGPPMVTIPSLSGITSCSGVTTLMRSVGLVPQCSNGYSSSVAVGGVVSETPSTQAPQGSTVTVVLSKGPQLVTVPQIPFGNNNLQATEQALTTAGFTLGNIVGTGPVIVTNPAPGTQAPEGSSVDIYRASGH